MKKLLVAASLFSSAVFAGDLPQKYIVKLKAGQKSSDIALFSQKAVQGVKEMNLTFGKYVSLKTLGLEKSQVNEIANHPAVEYIEKSQTYTVSPVNMDKEAVQDAKFSDQWGLKNTGRNSGGWFSRGKKGEDINAEKLWTQTRGSNEIKVAVIDTGVDYNHSDLKANMWVNVAERDGVEGVDDDGNGYVDDVHGYDFANNDGDPMDGHSHGTHCAGVIGALHNRSGVRGVMNNVKIVGIKFLSDRGSGETEDAIESIEYAIKVGVHVMSNSWGGGEFSQALKDAIVAANEAGIIFVAAAGNERNNNDKKPVYPANYKTDNMVTVCSHDGAGKKSGFSNYGAKTVHICAPGSNIMSTVPGNRYKKMSGTSMACPFVSGAMGALLAKNPNMTPLEAREQLIETAVETSSLKSHSASKGRMDAYKLVKNQR